MKHKNTACNTAWVCSSYLQLSKRGESRGYKNAYAVPEIFEEKKGEKEQTQCLVTQQRQMNTCPCCRLVDEELDHSSSFGGLGRDHRSRFDDLDSEHSSSIDDEIMTTLNLVASLDEALKTLVSRSTRVLKTLMVRIVPALKALVASSALVLLKSLVRLLLFIITEKARAKERK